MVTEAFAGRPFPKILIVAIELRDANYPGATYTLRHDKTTDQLIGSYHQPLNGQTYEISFERMQP